MDSNTYKTMPNPHTSSNILSRLFIWWMRRLIWKKKLTEDDLCDRLDTDSSEDLGNRLEETWNQEMELLKRPESTPSLGLAILRTFWVKYLLCSLFAIFESIVLRLAIPLLLDRIIQHFSKDSGITRDEALLYASGLSACVMLKSFFHNHYDMWTSQIGMRVRIACCSLVYRKILRLNLRALEENDVGHVINLISNDVSRFDLAAIFVNLLLPMLIQVPVTVFLLYQYTSWASIAGFAFIFMITVPTQFLLTKFSTEFRKGIAVKTDARIKLMNEIVSGIQVIKMYAWETPFAELVQKARRSEVQQLMKAAFLKCYLMASTVFIERATLFVTLLAYWILGNLASANQVFSMATLFNVLNAALAIILPYGVTGFAECVVSIKRIQKFLMLPEIAKDNDNKKILKGEVSFWRSDAAWTDNSPTLSNINLIIKPGTLCAIIGPVGSGKSSLLYAVLGELQTTSGIKTVGGTVSYCSQKPWVFAGTIRQNILFGQEYHARRYREVIKVCGLEKDFLLLPHADKTRVGDKGVTLSGGQKARINLARAIYKEADIYLLDDPFSAVDTQVGNHVFMECIRSYLANKTRILVTHQIQFLKANDFVVLMNKGMIEDRGRFNDIVESGQRFVKLLARTESGKRNDTEVRNLARQESHRKRFMKQESVQSTDSTELNFASYEENFRETIGETNSFWFNFWKYFTAGGGFWSMIFLFLIFIVTQVVTNMTDLWVTFWIKTESERSDRYAYDHDSNVTEMHEFSLLQDKFFFLSTELFVAIYGMLVLLCIVLTLSRSLAYFKLCMKASRNLHDSMFSNVLRATMHFFDTNPMGRIINRFSKDIGGTDEILPHMMLFATQIFFVSGGILIMLLIVNYILLIPLVIIGGLFIFFSMNIIRTGRNVKLLEGIRRSPMFSHVTDTMNGITTIRSFGNEEQLKREFDVHQDRHTSAWFLCISTRTVLGLWLDFICGMFITTIVFVFLLVNSETFAGAEVGLAISQSLILVGMVQFGIAMASETISQMTSVERVMEYLRLPTESNQNNKSYENISEPWPTQGTIVFKSVNLRYCKEDSPVLKNISFAVHAREKIGVVGRTGAGKSSLISALFRLSPVEGEIIIDGVETSCVEIHKLRRSISIIPQEPVLFTASLRFNLDPFTEFGDDDLWSVLEEVQLKASVKSLDLQVSEGGSNFSIGERQLVCLARAILRNSKILILDEATANVDSMTDALIQKTIRNKFKDCTVLTIAHRLNTVMDSDKIIVMDAGEIMEFGHPYQLLQKQNGYFAKLVAETGQTMAEKLISTARKTYGKPVVEENVSTTM